MRDPEAKARINSIPVLNIPAGLPPEIAFQIASQSVMQTNNEAIETTTPIAAIESSSFAVVNNNTINILYCRNANMALDLNLTSFTKGWIPVEG